MARPPRSSFWETLLCVRPGCNFGLIALTYRKPLAGIATARGRALFDMKQAGTGNSTALLRDHGVAFLLALCCGAIVQAPHWLFHRAFVNLDFKFHYANAREVVAAMRAGDPWPHYAFLAQFGLGEPGLLYYSPLYYMATRAAFALTGNVWAAMQLVEVVGAGALGYFCWRLAADYAPPRAALMTLPLAVISPMACLLHLSFNGYPWATAQAPLAALLWATLRPEAAQRWVNPAAIVALALTVCTHTVTGLMAVILLGAVSLAALIRSRLGALRDPAFWSPAITVVLGLALSAAYLLPAYGSQDLIDAGVWRTSYTPFNAFSFPTVTAWAFGLRWPVFQWPVSLLAVGLGGAALWQIGRGGGDNRLARLARTALVIVAVIVFLSSELSYPLWLINSPLRSVQFPHRLIALLVPLSAMLAGIAWARTRGHAVIRLALAGAALASMALGGLVIVRAATSEGRVIDVSERAFEPYHGLDEYRTAAAMRLPQPKAPFDWSRECADRAVRCAPGVRTGRGMAWALDAAQVTQLRLPVFCFPAWSLRVDGHTVPPRCDAERALVEVSLPAGPARIELQWQARPIERMGLLVSLLTAALLAALSGWQWRRSRRG